MGLIIDQSIAIILFCYIVNSLKKWANALLAEKYVNVVYLVAQRVVGVVNPCAGVASRFHMTMMKLPIPQNTTLFMYMVANTTGKNLIKNMALDMESPESITESPLSVSNTT